AEPLRERSTRRERVPRRSRARSPRREGVPRGISRVAFGAAGRVPATISDGLRRPHGRGPARRHGASSAWCTGRDKRGLTSVDADRGRLRTWVLPVLGSTTPIAAITTRDLDRLVEQLDKVKSTKTNNPRRIPIEPALMPLLVTLKREATGRRL